MIFGRHSVLKRGCSTWDKEQMPEAEFQTRLAAVRREMAIRDLEALVIYGDNYSFADLCYLTHYFPKVRGGLAVVPQSGAISLLLNIGSRDVPFAKTLTWVEDLRASGQVGLDGAELLRERGLERAKIGLVDSGQGFPLPDLEGIKLALPGVNWQLSDTLIQPLRIIKSARELRALRVAGRVLREICVGLERFIRPGRRDFEIVADIDRLARDKGVEDIRIMVGEKRLEPPGVKMNASAGSHWAVYLAIQYDRYWVETGRTYILDHNSKALASYQKAQEVLAKMAACLKPGNAAGSINGAAREKLGEFYPTASEYGLGNGIGLSQWERPFLSEDEAREMGSAPETELSLQPHMTLALRVAFQTEGKLILFGDSFEVTTSGAVSLLE
jgi:Xaa-Pro aminopeptidase